MNNILEAREIARNKLKEGLTPRQGEAFRDDSKCPLCKRRNIIRRKWRDDWFCGECKAVFAIVDGKICYLGNQKFLD